jgi:hypothetical protein
MTWIGLGDRDRLTEDELDCSMNVNSNSTAEYNCNAFIELTPPIPIHVFTPLEIPAVATRNRAGHSPRKRWRSGLNPAGIILKSNPATATGPEGLWPGGISDALFLTG